MNTAENAAPNDWMDGMLGEFLDESGQLLDRLNANSCSWTPWCGRMPATILPATKPC